MTEYILGYDTIGSGSISGTKYTQRGYSHSCWAMSDALAGGAAISISIYGNYWHFSEPCDIRLGLYSDNGGTHGGTPDNLLDYTEIFTVDSLTPQWWTADVVLGYTIEANTKYWVSVLHPYQEVLGNFERFYDMTVSAPLGMERIWYIVAVNQFVDPWTGAGSITLWDTLSLYLTYNTIQTVVTVSSDATIEGQPVDPTVFTYASVDTIAADIVTNYNAFDIKLKHICDHNITGGQRTLTTCPRCVGTGYYYDIKFNEVGKPLEVALVDKLSQTLEKLVLTENNDFHPEVAINMQQWLGESPISEIKAVIKFELSKSLMILMATQRGVPNLAAEAQIASIDSIEIFEDTSNPGTLDYAVTITTMSGTHRELTGTIAFT
jgi:hypothetical protein